MKHILKVFRTCQVNLSKKKYVVISSATNQEKHFLLLLYWQLHSNTADIILSSSNHFQK